MEKTLCCPVCGTEKQFTNEDFYCTDYCEFLNKVSITSENLLLERDTLWDIAIELIGEYELSKIIENTYLKREKIYKKLLNKFSNNGV